MNTKEELALLIEEDGEDYAGEYVTVADGNSKKVLCHGKNAVKVYRETQEMGYEDPVIIYVPEPGITYIYPAQNRQPIIDTYA